MKSVLKWEFGLGIVFVLLSGLFYFLHYELFHDLHHILLYLVGDLAFVFLEVFLITIVVHRLLSLQEKRSLAKKLNMVIGAFFSEAGTELLRRFLAMDTNSGRVCAELAGAKDWSRKEFSGKACSVKELQVEIADNADFSGLRGFLAAKRPFLVSLLANPALLEHETFSNLLWAVFHLTEELERRTYPGAQAGKDRDHLEGDIRRAYGLLLNQWLEYMTHLKSDYPYLFSLSARMNPFDRDASIEVQ